MKHKAKVISSYKIISLSAFLSLPCENGLISHEYLYCYLNTTEYIDLQLKPLIGKPGFSVYSLDESERKTSNSFCSILLTKWGKSLEVDNKKEWPQN